MDPSRKLIRRCWPIAAAARYSFLAFVFCTALAVTATAGNPPEIINAGRGGDNSSNVLARLEADALSHSPDVVVLLVGTNDLLNSRNSVAPARYKENLTELVKRIRERDIRVLLLTPPPAFQPYLIKRHAPKFYEPDGAAARIAIGNRIVWEVARKHRLPVVDVHAAFVAAGGANEQPECLLRNLANSGKADGVHPTPEGYRVMGDLVAAALKREQWHHVRRIVCLGDSITRGVHVKGVGTPTGETYPAALARALARAEN